jgi:hypothetical protein
MGQILSADAALLRRARFNLAPFPDEQLADRQIHGLD